MRLPVWPTGVAAGSTHIVATFDGVMSNTATLNVIASTLTSISLTPSTPSIPLGMLQQFSALGNYNNGTTTDLTTLATWSLTNVTGVGSISAGGLFSTAGGSPGTITVTATYSGISGQTTVTVPLPIADHLVLVAGDNQSQAPNTELAINPKVKVVDVYGNPVSGVSLYFERTYGDFQVATALQTDRWVGGSLHRCDAWIR